MNRQRNTRPGLIALAAMGVCLAVAITGSTAALWSDGMEIPADTIAAQDDVKTGQWDWQFIAATDWYDITPGRTHSTTVAHPTSGTINASPISSGFEAAKGTRIMAVTSTSADVHLTGQNLSTVIDLISAAISLEATAEQTGQTVNGLVSLVGQAISGNKAYLVFDLIDDLPGETRISLGTVTGKLKQERP